jgi:hypothetical protein
MPEGMPMDTFMISGKVLHKESGAGIPNLLVEKLLATPLRNGTACRSLGSAQLVAG